MQVMTVHAHTASPACMPVSALMPWLTMCLCSHVVHSWHGYGCKKVGAVNGMSLQVAGTLHAGQDSAGAHCQARMHAGLCTAALAANVLAAGPRTWPRMCHVVTVAI